MYKVGLTGPMGSGKSFATAYFQQAGIPVYDADAAVHHIYRTAEGIVAVEALFGPMQHAAEDGTPQVNRPALATALRQAPEKLPALEDALTPLLAKVEADFEAQHADAMVLLYDIPLLYERGRDTDMDAVVLMDAHPYLLRERVMKRPGMTPEKYDFLQTKFLPQRNKMAQTDFVIDTNGTPEQSQRQLDIVWTKLRHRALDKAKLEGRPAATADHTR